MNNWKKSMKTYTAAGKYNGREQRLAGTSEKAEEKKKKGARQRKQKQRKERETRKQSKPVEGRSKEAEEEHDYFNTRLSTCAVLRRQVCALQVGHTLQRQSHAPAGENRSGGRVRRG